MTNWSPPPLPGKPRFLRRSFWPLRLFEANVSSTVPPSVGTAILPPSAASHGATLTVVVISRPSSLNRSEEHTSELQSLMRISYAVFCLKKKNIHTYIYRDRNHT